MVSELANQVWTFLRVQGYQWKVNGELVDPVPEDVQQVLDSAKEALYGEEVPSQLEIGRLIIRRYADKKFDVYLHMGTYND